ncbi:DUF6083 domain-containing protein [Streptomyces vietnamensis]|uniref:DUF6083 domain-containing protein n=1 Tax=Streptomyces vietnamensis TaxID=362257 RepID=UPI00379735BB
MVAGRRRAECDSCGVPCGTWVASLGMALCVECERAGAEHPTREPVLVGDVLAALTDVMAQGARVVEQRGRSDGALRDPVEPGGAVRDLVASGGAVRDGLGSARAARTVRDGLGAARTVRDGRGAGAGVPEARAASLGVCDRCGARTEWHRTVRGRWIMIEPGELTTVLVPAGRRWRVAGDGTAVNLGPAVPSDTCRVSHFDVCPARPAPADSPVMLALWRSHARRMA